MKVLEFKGTESLAALNSFMVLVIGLKMQPAHIPKDFDQFLEELSEMSDEKRERLLRHAASIVPLSPEEVLAMARFCTDKNGIPFQAASLKRMDPKELITVIVTVAMELSKIQVHMVSEEEKKNSDDTALMSAVSSQGIPN